MVRSFAARAKLALASWMPLAFCGLAHCEGSLEARALYVLEKQDDAQSARPLF